MGFSYPYLRYPFRVPRAPPYLIHLTIIVITLPCSFLDDISHFIRHQICAKQSVRRMTTLKYASHPLSTMAHKAGHKRSLDFVDFLNNSPTRMLNEQAV